MIEGFVVLIISLIFWGKISKDTLEHNPKLDVVKTIVYFTLSVIVAIIYYKSSQVDYSTNYIEVKKLLSTTNDKNECSDSLYIVVNHRMTRENVRYMTSFKNFNPLGGVDINIISKRYYRNLKIDSTKLKDIYLLLNKSLEDSILNKEIPEGCCLSDIIGRYKEEIFQYRPYLRELELRYNEPNTIFQKKDSIELTNALKYIFKDQRSLYLITYIPPKRNTFLPIDVQKEDEIHLVETENDKYCYSVKAKSFLKEYIDPIWLKQGIEKDKIKKELDSQHLTAHQYYLGCSNVPHEKYVLHTTDSLAFLKLKSRDSLFNYVDYFTSSDMSQRVFSVSFFSEIPLCNLSITFDEPINISNIYPMPDTLSMNQIIYTDRKKLDYLRTRALTFHAKLPTYENKQLLRSLILTTILTAVFSLFCTNLYLCGRSILRKILKNRTVSDEEREKYKKRIAIYHWTIISIVILISTIPIILYYRYLSNDTLLLKSENIAPIIIYSVLSLIVLVVALNIWKNKLIPQKQSKDEKNKNDAENLHT